MFTQSDIDYYEHLERQEHEAAQREYWDEISKDYYADMEKEYNAAQREDYVSSLNPLQKILFFLKEWRIKQKWIAQKAARGRHER